MGDRVRIVRRGPGFNERGSVLQVDTSRVIAHYLVRYDASSRDLEAERFPEYDLEKERAA